MDARLIERWIAGAPWLAVADEAAVAVAREQTRAASRSAGLPGAAAAALVTAASELLMNQLRHAREGRAAVRSVWRGDVPGVEVVAADRGPGIDDPASALAGTLPPPAGPGAGLGAGLAAVRRLAHEVDVDVRLGEGTCVRARAFAVPVPRSEVAVWGRACPGEVLSGDDAAFARTPGALLLGVADGLGHGPEARAASSAALEALLRQPDAAPGDAIGPCAAAVAGTRGTVLAVARVGLPAGGVASREVVVASVGDVRAFVHGPVGTTPLAATHGYLGGGAPPRVRPARAPLGAHDLLVLCTDGLRSVAALDPAQGAWREEPIAVARDLARRFARGNDDLLVAVVR